jgi:signal peptidase I
MLRILRVQGRSLSPIYEEGDFVVIGKIPSFFFHLERGDIVVFHHPEIGVMIKMVDSISQEKQEIHVVGFATTSVDSRTFGAIPMRDVIGKVLWHIPRPRL